MAQDPTKCLARCRETVKIFWCPARRVGNSLIAHLLRSNERLWASRSDRSGQMSYCERFAKVAHDKWANRSFVEQIACLLIESLICSFAHKTGAIRSKNVEENNFFCTFFVSFFFKTSDLLISSFSKSDVSESLVFKRISLSLIIR